MARESAGHWEDGVRQCERILETIEDLPDSARDKGSEFFDGVETKVKGISETVSKQEFFSVNQSEALDNIEAAVAKWVR